MRKCFWWICKEYLCQNAQFWNSIPKKVVLRIQIYEADTFKNIFLKLGGFQFTRVTCRKIPEFRQKKQKSNIFVKTLTFWAFCEGYTDLKQWKWVIFEDLRISKSPKSSIFEQKKEGLKPREIGQICSHRFFFSIFFRPEILSGRRETCSRKNPR